MLIPDLTLLKLAILFFLTVTSSLTANYFEQGEKLFHQQKYAEAVPYFTKYLEQYPNHLKTLEYLGDSAAHLQQWQKAQGFYIALQRLQPQEADYYYKYGAALAMEAKESNVFKAYRLISKIEKALLTAARLNPKHIDVRWALVHLYLQIPALAGGSEKKAQHYADELISLSSVDGYLAKGTIEMYFKRYIKAEVYYKKAHEIGNSTTTFKKLYDLYVNNLNQPEKAKALQQKFRQ